jgi:hypothetical protein
MAWMEVNRQGMDWQLDLLFTTCSLAPQSQWVMEKKMSFWHSAWIHTQRPKYMAPHLFATTISIYKVQLITPPPDLLPKSQMQILRMDR